MKERKTIFLLCAAALGFRILHYLLFADKFVLVNDEMQNILLARHFAHGDFYGVLDTYWTPLYPILVGILNSFINSPIIPAAVVSIIAGSLAVPVTYCLIKQFYGHREAVIAAVLAVFFPHLINSMFEMGTENVYLPLIIGALIIGWKGLQRYSAIDYLLTGILLGLAYLTRPEAFGYLIFFAILSFANNLRERRLFGRSSATQVAALLLGFMILAAPYILYLKSATGSWTISGKAATNMAVTVIRETNESTVRSPGFDRRTGSVFIKSFASNLVEIQKTLSHLMPFLLMIFVALGLFGERWDKGRLCREVYLLLFCLFTVLGYAASVVQDRYFYILLPIFFGWMARGVIQAERWLRDSIQLWIPEKIFYLTNAKFLVILYLVFIYIYVFPINYFVRSEENAWQSEPYEERDAGLWLKDNGIQSPIIFSASLRPVFYSEGKQVIPATTNEDEILTQIKNSEADYIIVGERSLKRNPYLKNIAGILRGSPEFDLIYRRNDQPGYEILIFKSK